MDLDKLEKVRLLKYRQIRKGTFIKVVTVKITSVQIKKLALNIH